MKVAFVTPEFISDDHNFDGGLANYLFRVGLALKAEGHEPHVFVPSGETKVFDFQGITVHQVLYDNTDWRLKLYSWLTAHKLDYSLSWIYKSEALNRAVTECGIVFDIVQYASYGATAYYRVKTLPAVARISSYEPLHREARGVTNPTPDEKKYAEIELAALKKVDAIFGPSKLTAERIAHDAGRKVEVIETPFLPETAELDLSVYDEKLNHKQYLLFFGTLWRLKGVDTIADMIFELLDKHSDLHFVLVGKDFGSLPKVVAAAGKYADRVIYLGKLQHSQLYPVIEHATAVILPSLYDNFPNTCIEAMAFGKVVVGTYGTSFEQLIDDGTSGFLSNKGDAQSLLEVTEKVLALSDADKAKIGTAAKARIKLLAPEVVVQQLLELYRNTIKEFHAHEKS